MGDEDVLRLWLHSVSQSTLAGKPPCEDVKNDCRACAAFYSRRGVPIRRRSVTEHRLRSLLIPRSIAAVGADAISASPHMPRQRDVDRSQDAEPVPRCRESRQVLSSL